MAGEIRKIYICCSQDKRPLYEARAETKYEGKYICQNYPEDADLIFVIGPVTSKMEEEIALAKHTGIETQYVNENLESYAFIREALLSNRKSVEVMRSERAKSLDRER